MTLTPDEIRRCNPQPAGRRHCPKCGREQDSYHDMVGNEWVIRCNAGHDIVRGKAAEPKSDA